MLKLMPKRTAKYFISGKDVKGKVRKIDCTSVKKEVLEMLKTQKKLKTYIKDEVGVEMKLPILVVIES